MDPLHPSQPPGAAQLPALALGQSAFGPAHSAAPAGLITVTTEQKAQLLYYWRSVLKRRWAILALGAVVAGLAWVVASGLQPVYQTSAKVLIESAGAKVLTINDLYGGANQSRENQQTQLEILLSRENAVRTAQALQLWNYPTFDPRIPRPSLLDRAKAMLGVGSGPQKRDWKEPELLAAAAAGIQAGLTASLVRGSQLLLVSFKSEDPVLAAKIVNTCIEQYLNRERADRTSYTQTFNQQLKEQMTALREKVVQSEQALQQYRDSTTTAPTALTKGQSADNTMLNGLTTQLMQARTNRLALETAYNMAKSRPASEYNNIPALAKDPAVAEANRVVAGLVAKLKDQESSSGVEFWKIERTRVELNDARAILLQKQLAAIATLTGEYEVARSIEQSLDQGLASIKGEAKVEARQAVRDDFKLQILEREYQSNRQFYEQFLNRIKETSVAGDVQSVVGRMIDPALPASAPIAPDKQRIVLTALFLALLAGSAAAIALDKLDDTVKGGEDAEQRLKQPVLATVPQITNVQPSTMARLYLDDPHSHFAEAVRTARTGVMLSALDTPHKVLLITSSLPGEGKTTVAVNLALAHAQTRRTLLIDCDMRRSQVSRSLKLQAGIAGLSNLVAGTASVNQCIHNVPDSALFVLPVGDMPPNPLELLLSQRFKSVLAELSQSFEMIVIDSPPVELVSDALVITPMATSTAFVVKAMATPGPLIRRNLARVQRAGGHILGVVVNQLDFKHARQYYGEYGAGSYSYGGYGKGSLPYGEKVDFQNTATDAESQGPQASTGKSA